MLISRAIPDGVFFKGSSAVDDIECNDQCNSNSSSTSSTMHYLHDEVGAAVDRGNNGQSSLSVADHVSAPPTGAGLSLHHSCNDGMSKGKTLGCSANSISVVSGRNRNITSLAVSSPPALPARGA